MPGTMSKADLVADLKAMLMGAAQKFTDAANKDFERHLDIAALDLGRYRRRTLIGSVTLVADQANYAVPADFLSFKSPIWGVSEQQCRDPWEFNWPGVLPRVDVVEGGSGYEIYLTPAPTSAQITDLGSTYKFFYFAGHTIGDTPGGTSIDKNDRALLLIRATAEALLELANNGITQPVQLGPGVGSMPKNGTPGALAEQAYSMFERMAA